MAAPDPRPLLPDEARALLLERVSPLPAETLALTSALSGRVVAADVHAAHDLPPFDNSAMDGYAVRAADAGDELPVAGGSFAGDDPVRLEPHTAMTIATGAPLPEGADAVVPVELAHVNGDRVSFDGRRQPSATTCGGGAPTSPRTPCVVSAGSSLRPLALAAIATGGVDEVRCHRAPRVCVVVTGDELVAPGEPLAHGQIHESNSVLIAARCEQAGAEVVRVERVRDDAEATREALARALERGRRRRHLGRRLGRARAITSSPRSPRSASSSCSGASPSSPAGRPGADCATGASSSGCRATRSRCWSGSSCCCCRRCGASPARRRRRARGRSGCR